MTGWLGKLTTCSRRSMRAVEPDVIFFTPFTSASKYLTSMGRGRSMNGMRMLKPERARRLNFPRRSMTSTFACPMPVRRPHQLGAVGAEHWKRVELRVGRDPLEAGSIEAHEIEIERAAARVGVVRGEDDATAVGGEERREV